MKLIPLDAVLAEIDKKIEKAKAERVLYPKTILSAKNYLLLEDYNSLKDFINTLEVKGVDLNNHLDNVLGYNPARIFTMTEVDAIARHFFELGVNASNPLTWEDMRLIAEIGEEFMNSKDSDSFDEEGYYKEILKRFKAQKGEKV